ncbi:hypothetical protein KJK34_11560 [Flavobacterium sp. D11R37]|uniref:hypothetical protein n=1 Tax=Flavobacterium coralii TaxID=2838017 RepID=UPI001CA6C8D2|nr:hypothetical protein [Flavobacterium coralii]MBY8963390.1 hypothetical protein [Flavobacterium coralii]
MAKLENLSLGDVKSSLDFVRELKAEAIEDSKLGINDSTIKMLSDLEVKLRKHLYYRVIKLRMYD